MTTPQDNSPARQSRISLPTPRTWLLALLITLVAAALRIPGIFTDFWLDEIWALSLVRDLQSPLQIFTTIHFDTNHWLYSLFLFAIAPASSWIPYRLPALIAGILAVPATGLVMAHRGKARALLAMSLAALSYPLAYYSSEARGYSMLILFSLLAFGSARQWLICGRLHWLAAFWTTGILGLLAHLTYVMPWAAIGVWTSCHFLKNLPTGRALQRIAVLQGLPATVFALLYLTDIRFLAHGGSDPLPWTVLARTLAGYVLGPQDITPVTMTVIPAAIAVLSLGLYTLHSHKEPTTPFFIAIVVAPLALVALTANRFAFWEPRHFLACLPFFLLLVTEALFALANKAPAGRFLAAFFAVSFAASSLLALASFFKHGRGGYLDAMRFMADRSPNKTVSLSSDHDFRNPMLLNFYTAYFGDTTFLYTRNGAHNPTPTPWYLTHETDLRQPTPAILALPNGASYRRAGVFTYSGPSGWQWTIYEREP